MAVSKAQQEAFLQKIIPIAQEQARKHANQIFASVCIAQACHESGWGTSPKMVKANAVFGIKVGKAAYHFGTAWKGASYNTKTKEYYNGSLSPTVITDNFRAYDSLADSVEDYFDMLCHCQRYKAALNRKTPAECIYAIVAGGYATGPDYAKHIMSIINSHNLTQYDSGSASVKPSAPVKQPTLFETGKIYTLQSDLYVRLTPAGDGIKFDSLTFDGKKNGFFDDKGNAILRKGTRVTCQDTVIANGQTWMKIPSGWICAIKKSGERYIK